MNSASSEQFEKPTLLRREILSRRGLQLTKSGYHEPHLRYMGLATRAPLAMGLEPVYFPRGQRAFQVGRHQLRELAARHFRRWRHLRVAPPRAPSKYGSSAARARDRARCRSTR